jgi:hypothetical protein
LAGKWRILIPIRPEVAARKVQGLPAGIDLGPERLSIAFLEPAELLEKLVELSQALANDYSAFEAMVKPRGREKRRRRAMDMDRGRDPYPPFPVTGDWVTRY